MIQRVDQVKSTFGLAFQRAKIIKSPVAVIAGKCRVCYSKSLLTETQDKEIKSVLQSCHITIMFSLGSMLPTFGAKNTSV
jgi:hypothetical protein